LLDESSGLMIRWFDVEKPVKADNPYISYLQLRF
jgi:hypothetical protein